MQKCRLLFRGLEGAYFGLWIQMRISLSGMRNEPWTSEPKPRWILRGFRIREVIV